MEVVALDWPYCPDGAHIEARPEPGWSGAGSVSPLLGVLGDPNAQAPKVPFVAFRTAARFPQRLETRSLESPIVLDFANAHTDKRLLGFVANYGLPSPAWPTQLDAMPLAELQELRSRVSSALNDAGSAHDAIAERAASLADFSGPAVFREIDTVAGQRRAVYRVTSLRALMAHELQSIALNNVRVSFCEYCGDQFLTGSRTSHRSSRIYCGEACRKAAMRAKARAADGSAPTPGMIRAAERRAEAERQIEETVRRIELMRAVADAVAEPIEQGALEGQPPFRVPYV